MKVLITGGKGMLGRTLQKELAEHEIVVADLPDWDITDDTGFVEKVGAAKARLKRGVFSCFENSSGENPLEWICLRRSWANFPSLTLPSFL